MAATSEARKRRQPLTHSYPYLIVDARYENVRVDGRIVSQGALIVKGVRDDGKREILAVAVADTESEATWQELFVDLKARGLAGVMLITSDNHAGLKKSSQKALPGSQLAALSGALHQKRHRACSPGRPRWASPCRRRR